MNVSASSTIDKIDLPPAKLRRHKRIAGEI
jgi:hypothetical protein